MLVDFGIAKLYDPNAKTTLGARAITPGYSPPEQYGSGKTDAQSDIYALGATLYTLLTGQCPPDSVDLIAGVVRPLAPARQINPAVSLQVSAALHKALKTNKAERWVDFIAGLALVAGVLFLGFAFLLRGVIQNSDGDHNITISAIETGIASAIWGSQPIAATATNTAAPSPTTTRAPAKGSIVIDSVIGPGDLYAERVLLKFFGEGELSLAGWRLEGSLGNILVFPNLALYQGGAINVYTKAGQNTVIDLYWGLNQPVWFSGSKVLLRDAQGSVIDIYIIP